MARISRPAARLLALAAAAAAGWLAFVSWADRVDPADALPAGVENAVQLRDLDGLLAQVEGTRFAAAFARGALAAWIEESEAVRGLDALRDGLRASTGIAFERRHLLDLVGRETAVAWNRAPAGEAKPAWVAAGRMSTRAWAIVRALLLLDRTGVLPLGLVRERDAMGELLALPAGTPGHDYHAFLVGRLLVVGNDRPLVRGAARSARTGRDALVDDPAWTGARERLPEGDGFLWTRDALRAGDEFPGIGAVQGTAAAAFRAGERTEIHLFAPALSGEAPSDAEGFPPGAGLLAGEPLLLLASRGVPPPALADLLGERSRRVSGRSGSARQALPTLAPGFMATISGVVGPGPFPRPEGAIAFTLADPGSAEETLGLLFPPSARTAPVAGTVARSTRESLPLSGELEVWGAALGPRLVLATGTGQIEALAEGESSGPPPDLPRPSWAIEALSSFSGSKALPILLPYRPFLSGWLAASRRGFPDLGRDLELLGAVRSATFLTGSDEAGRRALVLLRFGDLPEGPSPHAR